MKGQAWQRFICSASVAILTSWSPRVHAQDLVLASGQSVDLGRVFWAEGCSSRLLTVVGVDLLEGPPGVQLSIRREDVQPRQENCPKVPGGIVVASVKDVAVPGTTKLRYRVRYQTNDGPKQSEHSIQVSLQP